ncbi:MAG TPA: hypothetical protein VM163_10985 [bacterium]|nr:hypothetical protein [bacterium]
MQTARAIIAILLLVMMLAITPCFAKQAKDEAPESVRFWVSPDGDVFVEETRRVGGFFSKVKHVSSGVLLRLRWPATVIWEGLPDEPVLDSPHGSAHFIGGERLFAVTSQLAGEDDYRILFWDGIHGIWRLLAPMATLQPVRGVFRMTLGPKRWVSLASPDDGMRVCGYVLDDYLADVKTEFCLECAKPRSPKCVVQSADGKLIGIVMAPQKPTVSQRSRMTESGAEEKAGTLEVAIFDVSGTETTVKVNNSQSLVVGETKPASIVAVGDTFVCLGLGTESLRLNGFRLSGGKVITSGPEFTTSRLGQSSMVDLAPSVHNDGFILIDSDGQKVLVRKLAPSMTQVGNWKLNVPKEAERPVRQMVFNEKMAFLYVCDSKGRIILCTTAGSTDTLWPRQEVDKR